jgi:hypothetical protein
MKVLIRVTTPVGIFESDATEEENFDRIVALRKMLQDAMELQHLTLSKGNNSIILPATILQNSVIEVVVLE